MLKCSTVPIKDSITRITGYKTLIIFKLEKSPYWWARFYEFGKIHKKSTKTENKEEALVLAKKFYLENSVHVNEEEKIKKFKSLKLNFVSESRIGYVYIIGVEGTDIFKIGWSSTDVKQRLGQLQVAHHSNLKIVYSSPLLQDAPSIEKKLHVKYAEFNKRGEWFSLNENHITEIKRAFEILF